VLVVDDDPDSCELIESVLHASGAEVRATSSAREALGALGGFRPDVLLSDIGMPDQDGYALIGQVRAREEALGGHLAAIALTAFASQADRERALAHGFDAYLAKPASPDDILRAVASQAGRA
jgi:CheY-like chemotaxis protein